MSEAVYEVGDKLIRYSDTDNEFPCLCTFPKNKDDLTLGDMRSLFVFGCIALLVLKGYYDELEGEYVYIPQDVPLYVLDYARTLQMMNETLNDHI